MSEKIWDDVSAKSLPVNLGWVDNTEDFNIEIICCNGEFLQELSK